MSKASTTGPCPLRLLLVEDSLADASLLTMCLEDSGVDAEVEWLTNGEDAIAFIQRKAPFEDAPLPDLAIVDLNIPRCDGFEVLSAIRSTSATRDLPVIIFTSSTRAEDRKLALGYPRVSFIAKPRELSDYEALGRRLVDVELKAVH